MTNEHYKWLKSIVTNIGSVTLSVDEFNELMPIVRCGNCIHWACKVDNNGVPFHFGYCWEHGCEFWDNDFCSSGKDKNDCN